MRTRKRLAFALLCLALAAVAARAQGRFDSVRVVSSHTLHIGGAALQVDFGPGTFNLGEDAILNHVRMAATAVATYYGRFPVARARVLIVPAQDRHGVMHGTTWGDVEWGGMSHWPAFTRISIGTESTQADLNGDWMMTHELVHMAFPSVPDKSHWIEEGIATYVEPIARVQAGGLTAAKIWHDMLRDMPQGEPQPGDEGLDRTHTWGRTYWGGALFCLVADVTIRRETHNKKGLQDALRAIVDSGGNIADNWDLEKALKIGDHATGTHVLTRMYAEWKHKPVNVDLDKLWQELGVSMDGETVRFDNTAPLASVRRAITEPEVN